MRAILVMTLLLIGWFFWFAPQQPPVQPPPVESDVASDALDPGAVAPLDAPQAADAAGFLPPAPEFPEDYDPAQDEVTIRDEYLELTFTKIGGRLKRALLVLGEEGQDSVQLVPELPGVPDSAMPLPFHVDFSDEAIGTALNSRRFEASPGPDGKSVLFTLTVPGHFELRKTFALIDNPHIIRANVSYTNLSDAPTTVGLDATPAYTFGWRPNVITKDQGYGSVEALIWRPDGVEENQMRTIEDLPRDDTFRVALIDWFGYKSKYFLVAFKPEFEQSNGWGEGSEEAFSFGLTAPRFIAQPGEPVSHAFDVYVGPMELDSLGQAWDDLPSALTFFTMFDIMDWFAKLLLNFLHWLHSNVYANYGIAIILLTVVVRLVMLPLTLKSMKSMKRMQALGPEIEKLKEEYKDDQQEMSKAMMQLYRERGVNPIGGCLPMLLQMPIFIALYRMLWNAFELRGAPFLWIEDLSQPDALFHIPALGMIPFFGQWIQYINLLPILMAGAMVLSMKITPTAAIQNPQQKMMMTIMPVIFAVFCYPLAAGLNLYVLTSTILGIVQTALVKTGKPAEVPEPVKKREVKKPTAKNVWTRAQQAKRQQKKDMRRQQSREARMEKIARHRGGDDEGKPEARPVKGANGQTSKKKGQGKKKKGRTR